MPSTSSFLPVSEPSVNELLQHPDSRQVATFFVGWVFALSAVCILSSSVAYVKRGMSSSQPTLRLSRLFPVIDYWAHKAVRLPKTLDRPTEAENLGGGAISIAVFMLYISFALACLAKFVSLLTFTAASGPFACAFSISWSGISSVCGRLWGLLTVCHELRKLGATWIEVYMLYFGIITVLALAIAEYTISTGVAKLASELNTYLCCEIRYLPVSIARSVVHVLLAFHVLGRLLSLIAPRFLAFRHRIGAITDTRAVRVVSLLICEVLFVVSSVRFIGIVGDSLLFAAGSLLVLVSFYKDQPTPDDVNDLITLSPVSTITPRASALLLTPLKERSCTLNHSFESGVRSSSAISIGSSTFRSRTMTNVDGLFSPVTILSPTLATASKIKHTPARHVLFYEPRLSFTGEITRTVDRRHPGPCFTGPEQSETVSGGDEFSDQGNHGHNYPRELVGSPGYCAVLPSTKLAEPMSIPVEQRDLVHNSAHTHTAGVDMDEGRLQRHSQIEYPTVEYPSADETATSQQSWLSLVKPIPSAEQSLVLSDTEDPWLTFGGCSLSPMRRQRFSDQSLLVSRRIKSADTLEAQFRSSRLAHWPTLKERHLHSIDTLSSERRPEVKGSMQRGPNCKMTRTCLRGPRPQPKVLHSTTPRDRRVVSDS
ncbi:hypothetical protein EDC04DRAFT_2621927 [Pisolithus marmoratus]|nr:hypothetical protein EDC04DRAFT_2621927 [Pisolithus marmoratus]